MANNEKGSKENPYSWSEYSRMIENGTWTGGYVKDDAGEVTYAMAEVTCKGYSGSGSGSGIGGSDFEFSTGSHDWTYPDTETGSDGGGETVTGNEGGTGTGGNMGGGWSGGQSSSNYNKSAAVSYLVAHADESYVSGKSGHCARAVREALEAGGLSMVGHPVSACEYDGFLPKVGFTSVVKEGYVPRLGDIVVLEAVDGHPYGHIAMYSGTQWVSDFKQRDMWGGSAYRNKARYTLWRK